MSRTAVSPRRQRRHGLRRAVLLTSGRPALSGALQRGRTPGNTYERHPEKTRARSRGRSRSRAYDPEAAAHYRRTHPDSVKEHSRRWRERHKKEIAAYRKRYYAEHDRIMIGRQVFLIHKLPEALQAVAVQIKEARLIIRKGTPNV